MPYSLRWVISPHQTQSFANLVKAALNSPMWWDPEVETSRLSHEKWPQWLVSLQICCLHGSHSSTSGLPGRYTVHECTIYRLTCRTWTEKTRRWQDLKVYLHSSPVGLDRWSANRRTLNPDQDGSSSSPPKHESSWYKKKGVMCTSWYFVSDTRLSKKKGTTESA